MNTQLNTRPGPTALLAPSLDYIALDGSSSMLTQWFDVQAAIDEYLNSLRTARANSHLILSSFCGGDRNLIQRNGLLCEQPSCLASPLTSHFGRTPLFDAINIAGWTFRDLAPTRGVLLICTDGDENASKFTSLAQAKAILDWMRAKGHQVIFFGCDFNNSLQARALGATADSAIGIERELLTEGAKLLAKKRIAYGQFGTDIRFSNAEQATFGGLLGGPKAQQSESEAD